MKAARLPIAALISGVVALAGCGGDDNNDSGATGASEPSTAAAPAAGGGESVKLSETEFKITPAAPAVKKTGTVTLKVTNDGAIVHALEVEGPGGEAKTADIPAGESATLKVDLSKAGTYEMYCPIDGHKAQGMKGTIAVAGGGSGKVEESSDEDSGGSQGY